MPTATLEEYLETIYKLSETGAVRPSQIAESVGVSGPTVTATLRRLESHGLVDRDGTDVILTDEGRAQALDIVRRHRVAERFLVDVLGLEWDEAHEDACLLEHALSPRVLVALERYLGDPSVCPHGHPIPSADGRVAPVQGRSLESLTDGKTAIVLRVTEDEETLGYLGELGFRPGVSATVVSREPFGGSLLVRIDGFERSVPVSVARLVTVE